jgi:hypothetical protein
VCLYATVDCEIAFVDALLKLFTAY